MIKDFIEVIHTYRLQFIIEPNKFLYFIDIIDLKLHCSENKFNCAHLSYQSAVAYQIKIKDLFGLNFDIIKE